MKSILRRADGRIDWEAVRSKLRTTDSVSDIEQLSAERRQAILNERAKVLAQVPEQPSDIQEVLQLLLFQLGEETFAIETKYVYEVVRDCRPVRIPDVPSFVVGITNLRGELLAVMDLKESFGIPTAQRDSECQLIVLGLERIEFGVVADAVHEVCSRRIDEIHEAPGSIVTQGQRNLRGATMDAMLVLDGISLLEDERFYIDLDD